MGVLGAEGPGSPPDADRIHCHPDRSAGGGQARQRVKAGGWPGHHLAIEASQSEDVEGGQARDPCIGGDPILQGRLQQIGTQPPAAVPPQCLLQVRLIHHRNLQLQARMETLIFLQQRRPRDPVLAIALQPLEAAVRNNPTCRV